MQYARTTWLEERSSWRAVVQLNLVRSVTLLLDMLAAAMAAPHRPPTADLTAPSTMASTSAAGNGNGYAARADSPPPPLPLPLPPLAFTERHQLLKLRLAPLRGVQTDLERRLGAAAEEPTSSTIAPHEALPLPPASGGAGAQAGRRPQEFYVRSRDGWKSALERFRPRGAGGGGDGDGGGAAGVAARAAAWARTDAEVAEVLAGLGEDMKAVWEDGVVREMLKRRKVRMEEAPGL